MKNTKKHYFLRLLNVELVEVRVFGNDKKPIARVDIGVTRLPEFRKVIVYDPNTIEFLFYKKYFNYTTDREKFVLELFGMLTPKPS